MWRPGPLYRLWEDGETILISKPERFRECGEGLIQDE